ncbi:MAG TPA: trehalose-6-phosphate synthase [Acidimicrobiales bacterium]|nr:trehalose-6-phosphate synthase [Acidimicrobiales bacterium]
MGQLGEEIGSSGPLIVVSNRGPVEHGPGPDGQRTTRRGGGGLVTALSGLAAMTEAVWVCNAITDEDRAVARESGGQTFTLDDGTEHHLVRMVETDPQEYHRFYSIIANPILWFIQHNLWDLSNAPDITATELEAFYSGYVPVNEALAAAAADELDRVGPGATVMVHDYQLYLVPALLRQRCPEVFLHHFVHIPWPAPEAWKVLPARLREPLLHGLLANDIVAFHTEQYARSFLHTCQELLELPVDLSSLSVQVGNRTVHARWYPISIDPAALEAETGSPEVAEIRGRLENVRREHLILRVDRTDLSKNILRGFKAFDQLLRNHPDLTGRVTFLALLQPSRQDVEQYSEYLGNIRRLVADINLEHGNAEWQPIDLRLEDSRPQAMAAYQLFDVLLVNPVLDGLNLVAKEGMLLNEHDGVLVLSEHAGAHAELGAFCLSVHPFDIEAQAEALWHAIIMDRAERRARRDACVQVIRANDIRKWLQQQLADITALRDPDLVALVDLTSGARVPPVVPEPMPPVDPTPIDPKGPPIQPDPGVPSPAPSPIPPPPEPQPV